MPVILLVLVIFLVTLKNCVILIYIEYLPLKNKAMKNKMAEEHLRKMASIKNATLTVLDNFHIGSIYEITTTVLT